MTYAERVAALEPMTHYGPSYSRGVAASLADSALFQARQETEAAERYLLQAELRAKVITFEEYQSLIAAIEGKLALAL